MMGVIRTVHNWAGAILSVLLIVLGLTGSLLVVEDDWIRLTTPQARAGFMADAATLGAAAERLEGQHADLRTVNFGGEGFGAHKLYLGEEGHGYAARDGATLDQWTGVARAETFVFELHHYLLAGDVGMTIGGLAALAAVLLVLTGLVVWAPAWRATRWRVWPRSTKRSEMVSTHRNLGLIAAIPVLLFAGTGAAIVFNDETRVILAPGAPEPPPPPVVGEGDIDWPSALAAAQAQYPQATLRMAGWPSEPGKPASIRLKQPAEWHPNGRTRVLIDPATSGVVQTVDSETQDGRLRMINAFYPIHGAFVGGWLYRSFTVLAGLALAVLGGVGTWSFLVKPRRRRRARQVAAA